MSADTQAPYVWDNPIAAPSCRRLEANVVLGNTPPRPSAGITFNEFDIARGASDHAAQLEIDRCEILRCLKAADLAELIDDDTVKLAQAGNPNALGRHLLSKLHTYAAGVAAYMNTGSF